MSSIARLGCVSTEGGPLLLADHAAIGDWRGTEGTDYDQVCAVLDDRPDARGLQHGAAVVWDMPTGTAEVWRTGPRSLRIVWATDENDDVAALPAHGPVPIGEVVVTGWLVVVWAVEDGQEIADRKPSDGLSLDLSVGGAGIVAALPPGTYRCAHDEVELDGDRIRRCLIEPA